MSTLARDATRQRAASDIAMQVSVRVLNLALGVFVTALLVRTLGTTGYGEWATTLIVLGLIAYIMNFGMEEVALREAAKAPETENEWIGAAILMRLLLLGPVMISAYAALLLLPHTEDMLIAGAILIVAMPFGGMGALGLLFRLRVDNRIPMLVLTLRSILWGIAVVIIHQDGGGLIAFAIGMVTTNMVGSIVQTVAAVKIADVWPRPNRKHVRTLARVSLPIGISGLLIAAYARIDGLLVYAIGGAHEAGLYNAIYNVLDQSHFIPISILTTLAPVLAAAWPHNRERLLRTARLIVELLSIASFGALAVAIVANEQLVRLVFGAEFVEAAPALPVLGGAFILICYGYLNGNLLLVLGKQKLLLRISLVALVVNLAGNAAAIPLFGFMGAAWMTVLTEAVVLIQTTRLLVRELPTEEFEFGRVVRTAVAAVILGLVLGAMEIAGAPLAALLAAACVLYPVLLFALRAFGPEDLRLVLRRGATV
jgi:O-antigen/teichoic acid export membrane protein